MRDLLSEGALRSRGGEAVAPGGLGERRVLRWDPYLEPDDTAMQFRLTYTGRLLSHRDDPKNIKARAPHKHGIRKEFHRQLKVLWYNNPNLMPATRATESGGLSHVEKVGNNFSRNGFRFVPLVTNTNGLICKIEILMLRPGRPGSVFHMTDIDNRLKTLFDALRMPSSGYELGGHPVGPDEDPFFVLLEDDRSITHAVVEADMLLQPVDGDENDARVVIKVTTQVYHWEASPIGLV